MMRKRIQKLLGKPNHKLTDEDLLNFSPMKLVIGLGNPGTKYATTRHNAGFMVVDELVHQYDGTQFVYNKKFSAEVSTGIIDKRQVLFAKPQTFMNKSGISVRSLANFYDISPDNILIIQDDIDHEFGKIKLKFRGSHGGHNGIRDIIEKLGTKKFRRLKLGVGRPPQKHLVTNFVLGKMNPDELKHWLSVVDDLYGQVELWLKNTG